MERIKQALELARQERQNHSGSSRVIPAGKKSKKSIAEQKIEYTETRSVGLPIQYLREKRIIVDQQSSVSDAYRLLRTQVLQRLNEKDWNTLAITSPSSGAGKSLTAINLAISLAREVNNTVLLVDANLRSPSLHKQLNFLAEYGLSDYLSADISLEKILVQPEGVPRLVVLPAGNVLENSSEMLSSPKMHQLVEELKYRYPSRIVLFDLPPLLESSDALAFIPNVDASLVVIEEGGTSEQDLKQAFELLQSSEVLGTVLNKAYTRDRDYGSLDVKPGFMSNFITNLSKRSLPAWMK